MQNDIHIYLWIRQIRYTSRQMNICINVTNNLHINRQINKIQITVCK